LHYQQRVLAKPFPKGFNQFFSIYIYMWAEPTWDFLLTFVIKIGHVFFEQHRTECLNILFNITQILPCKNCIKHAQQYFTEKSFFSIQNKTELIQFMKDYI